MAGMMAKAKEMQSKVEEAQAKVSEIEVMVRLELGWLHVE